MPRTRQQQPEADLLKGATKRASKAPAKDKKELPTKRVSPELEGEVSDLIRLATVHGELDPLVKQHKTSVGDKLLDLWVGEMWETKKVPSNFRVPIMKKENGRATLMKDMEVTFQVKFRADGLTKKVPESDELPEGESVEDKLLEALVSEQVGLTEEKAKLMLDPEEGHVTVEQQLTLTDTFNKLYHSENEAASSGIKKILKYIQATATQRGQKTVELPLLTDEEGSAVLKTKQVVILKEDFFSEARSYCQTQEVLGKLIRFCDPTLALGGFEFGVSDKTADRVERLSNTVEEFLTGSQS